MSARWGRILRLSLEAAERPRWARRARRRLPAWLWAALVAFTLGVLVGARLEAAPAPVSLQVRPQIMIQRRGDIHVEARVPRAADNRLLAIAWTSDGGSAGATQRSIDGEDGPVLHTLWLPGQPAAHYLFVATLINKFGKVAGRATAEIHVPDDGGNTR